MSYHYTSDPYGQTSGYYQPQGQPQYQYQHPPQHPQHAQYPQGYQQSHSGHHGHSQPHAHLPPHPDHRHAHPHHQPHAQHHHGHHGHHQQQPHAGSSNRPQRVTYRQMLNEIEQKYKCRIDSEAYIQHAEGGRDVHSAFYYFTEHGGRKICIGSSSLENSKGEAKENAARQAVSYLTQAGYKI